MSLLDNFVNPWSKEGQIVQESEVLSTEVLNTGILGKNALDYSLESYIEGIPVPLTYKGYDAILSSSWYRSEKSGGGTHWGLDFHFGPVSYGVPIYATMSGRLVYSKSLLRTGKASNLIHIVGAPMPPDIPKPIIATYAHMQAIYPKDMEIVKAGQLIGEMGNVGYYVGTSTAAHLHYQIQVYQPGKQMIYEDGEVGKDMETIKPIGENHLQFKPFGRKLKDVIEYIKIPIPSGLEAIIDNQILPIYSGFGIKRK